MGTQPTATSLSGTAAALQPGARVCEGDIGDNFGELASFLCRGGQAQCGRQIRDTPADSTVAGERCHIRWRYGGQSGREWPVGDAIAVGALGIPPLSTAAPPPVAAEGLGERGCLPCGREVGWL